jgi:acetyl-CoA acetyltransferase
VHFMFQEVVIVEGARTAMVDYMGDFSDVSAIELGAMAAKEAVRRSGFSPEEFDHVFMGNALQTSARASRALHRLRKRFFWAKARSSLQVEWKT